MYPAIYFGLFPAFPRDDRVFVAMGFDASFDARFANVIAPAIQNVRAGDKPLAAHRVDVRRVCDSVLTEILEGIAHCRFFVADITAIAELNGRAVRNANVMYELGLAHATRLPEEVLLLRSDASELDFDVRNVRVHTYDPDGAPDESRRFLTDVIVESMRELDLRRNLSVNRVATSLGAIEWLVLFEARGQEGGVRHPPSSTMGEALSGMARTQAIAKLLEFGLISAELGKLTPDLITRQVPMDELVSYRITPFGEAVAHHGMTEIGAYNEDVQRLVRETPLAGDTEAGSA